MHRLTIKIRKDSVLQNVDPLLTEKTSGNVEYNLCLANWPNKQNSIVGQNPQKSSRERAGSELLRSEKTSRFNGRDRERERGRTETKV